MKPAAVIPPRGLPITLHLDDAHRAAIERFVERFFAETGVRLNRNAAIRAMIREADPGAVAR